MITINIYNSEKHKEGDFLNKWISLPTTKEEMKEHLNNIQITDDNHHNVAIAYHQFDIKGIESLSVCNNLNEKNYLANLLANMTPDELEKFEAAAMHGDNSRSTLDLINLTYNLECYELYPADDYETLGMCIAEDVMPGEIPKWSEKFFDYESFGKSYAKTVNGKFVDMGYVIKSEIDYQYKYFGNNIPEEYKILTESIATIKDQLIMYGKIAAAQPMTKPKEFTQERG